MSQAQETIIKSPETNKTAKTASRRSFSPDQLWQAIRSGQTDSEDLKLFESIAGNLTPENTKMISENMAQRENCSPAFAEKWITDKTFRKRVGEICKNFNGHGETMQRLEEAEIFTALMDPSVRNIDTLMDSTNPNRQFRHLEKLTPDERSYARLMDFRHAVSQIPTPAEESQAKEVLQRAFAKAGLTYTGEESDWEQLAALPPERIHAFMQDSSVEAMYAHINKGKSIQSMHRAIQLHWRTTEDGTRVPAMGVEQLAKNPKTGYISRLGFELEKEPSDMPGGKDKRVLKDAVIVIDEDCRSNSSGTEFITNNLRNSREYKIDEAEFVANINVGSYVWSRISDIDTKSMGETLPREAKQRLGNKPWDEKRVRSEIFQNQILPQFEKNLVSSIYSVLNTIDNPQEKEAMSHVLIDDLLKTKYEALRQKAETGELTMEELTSLGKGLDLFRFDSEGAVVPPSDPNAKHHGHLGKAAIMGIPWKARIGLDTKSLFKVVDRLTGGSGFSAFLKRSATKIGLALSSL